MSGVQPTIDAKSKGVVFLGLLECLQEEFGEASIARIQAGVPGVLLSAIHGDEWYPFELYLRFLKTIDEEFGQGDGLLVRRLSAQGAERDIPRLYRLVAKVLNPAYIALKGGALWSSVFSGGELEVAAQESNRVEAHYHGLPVASRFFWEDIRGSTVRILELAGARGVTFTIVEGGGDATFLRARYSWF